MIDFENFVSYLIKNILFMPQARELRLEPGLLATSGAGFQARLVTYEPILAHAHP